ncbi:hypothetical protein J421_3975 [Gemmatirosa kalamazoonensis]|uniref:Uncharacterized protein n=1 Tax=Gemmatirosa kalamazoonensis TaxID=861299 RepID=W0RM25_9BACT|nr:hypothetical protein [Gemmatirosa kalamazoonensis]AHG91512.1 hypothetical protein J421_3975 [Gemmatirosa kalamazoonensis]
MPNTYQGPLPSDESLVARSFRALGAVLALLFLGACGGEQPTAVASIIADRNPPVVALSKTTGTPPDSVLSFQLQARDDLGLKSIHVRLVGGVAGAFDTTFTSAVTTVTLPYSVVVARSVPVGTIVTVIAQAVDGNANTSTPDSLRLAVGNVTPPKVTITGPAAGTLFVVGKSGVLSFSARSQLKVKTVGFTTTGPYRFADSTILKAPLKDSVAVLDTLVVPDTVKAGVIIVTPFVIDSLGQRATGDPVSYAVQPISAVNSIPTVGIGLHPRVEVLDTVHVSANDPTGITRLGYEVRSLTGTLLAADSGASSGNLTVAESTFTWRLKVSPPATVVVKSFATNAAGRRSYAKLANGLDRADTVLLVAGLTRNLPNGGRLADAIYLPRYDRLYLTNIDRNQLEVFSLPDTQFLAPVLVGSRPWGISAWPRDRAGNAADTLLVANSGGTNVSYVDLRRGSTGREVYRYPLPNIHVCSITTEVSSSGQKFQQRTCYDFTDRPQFIASTCSGPDDGGPCDDAIVVYSTSATGAQPTPFPNRGTVRWENLITHASHFFFEQAIGQQAKRADTLEITRYAAQGVGSDSVLVPYQTRLTNDNGDQGLYSVVVDVGNLAFRDTTFLRNSGNFRRAIIGEGGPVKGSRSMMYDASRGMQMAIDLGLSGVWYFDQPMMDRGISRYFDVSDYVVNSNARVLGVSTNFDGELSAIRADSTYIIDPTLRLQGLMQTNGGSNAGFDFHPMNTGLNSPISNTRLAFSASTGPQIEVFDTYCYQKVGTIEVRDPIVGPIKASVRPDGRLVLVGASATGVIVVTVDRPFASSCAGGMRAAR